MSRPKRSPDDCALQDRLASWSTVTITWQSFAIKRILRIVPGLLAVLLVTVFLIGPFAVTDRSAYFHNPHTYKYLGLIWTHDINTDDRIPGVFVNNPEHGVVNGSLWTIRYEMISYVLVAIFGAMMLCKKPWTMIPLTLGLWFLRDLPYADIHSFGKYDNFFHLETFFFVGALYYLFRTRIPHSGWIALGSVVMLFVSALMHYSHVHNGQIEQVYMLRLVDPLLLSYLVFYLAYCEQIKLQHFAKYGDFSYGLYLYACPIQQLLVQYVGSSLNQYTMFIYSFCLTLLAAIASWKIVEQPFLRLKPKSKKIADTNPPAKPEPVVTPVDETLPTQSPIPAQVVDPI